MFDQEKQQNKLQISPTHKKVLILCAWLCGRGQGCQIFLGAKYQNGGKYTKLTQIDQMDKKYTKWPQNV
jgi:hypothetical protein